MIKNNEDSIEINYSISKIIGIVVSVQSYNKVISPAVFLVSRVPLIGLTPVLSVSMGALLAYQLYSRTSGSVSSVLSHSPVEDESTITIDKRKIREFKSRLMELKLKLKTR